MGLLLEPPNVASTSPQLCHTVVLLGVLETLEDSRIPPKVWPPNRMIG